MIGNTEYCTVRNSHSSDLHQENRWPFSVNKKITDMHTLQIAGSGYHH
jgi:hypothetical protein